MNPMRTWLPAVLVGLVPLLSTNMGHAENLRRAPLSTPQSCEDSKPDEISTGSKIVIAEFSFTRSKTTCPFGKQWLGTQPELESSQEIYLWIRFAGNESTNIAYRLSGCVHKSTDFYEVCRKIYLEHDQIDPSAKREAADSETRSFDWRYPIALQPKDPGSYELRLWFGPDDASGYRVCMLRGSCSIPFTTL